MSEMMSVKELINAGRGKELRERGEKALLAKGLIYTRVFGWVTKDEYNFCQQNLDAVKYGKKVEELTGIPCMEETITETTDRKNVIERKSLRVLAFVFKFYEMQKERGEKEFKAESAKRKNFEGIIKSEPKVAEKIKLNLCPICGSEKHRTKTNYANVKWVDCLNCNTTYDQLSGKTLQEWNDDNKA